MMRRVLLPELPSAQMLSLVALKTPRVLPSTQMLSLVAQKTPRVLPSAQMLSLLALKTPRVLKLPVHLVRTMTWELPRVRVFPPPVTLMKTWTRKLALPARIILVWVPRALPPALTHGTRRLVHPATRILGKSSQPAVVAGRTRGGRGEGAGGPRGVQSVQPVEIFAGWAGRREAAASPAPESVVGDFIQNAAVAVLVRGAIPADPAAADVHGDRLAEQRLELWIV